MATTKKETEAKAPAKKATNTKANAGKVEKMEEKKVAVDVSVVKDEKGKVKKTREQNTITNEQLKALTAENLVEFLESISFRGEARKNFHTRFEAENPALTNAFIEWRTAKEAKKANKKSSYNGEDKQLASLLDKVAWYCNAYASQEELKKIIADVKTAVASVTDKKKIKKENNKNFKTLEKIDDKIIEAYMEMKKNK